jgi:hypothetical protein
MLAGFRTDGVPGIRTPMASMILLDFRPVFRQVVQIKGLTEEKWRGILDFNFYLVESRG